MWPRLEKSDPRVLAVKDAVLKLNLGRSIKPFWFEPGVSVDVERVLVLADGFQYSPVIDYIYPKNPAMMKEAVQWALGVKRESRGARDSMAKMREIFGEELRETTEEAWEEASGNY